MNKEYDYLMSKKAASHVLPSSLEDAQARSIIDAAKYRSGSILGGLLGGTLGSVGGYGALLGLGSSGINPDAVTRAAVKHVPGAIGVAAGMHFGRKLDDARSVNRVEELTKDMDPDAKKRLAAAIRRHLEIRDDPSLLRNAGLRSFLSNNA